MSKISIYDVVPVPKLADKLIGTSVGGDPEDLTYNFTLAELLNLFIPNIPGNTLQGVLDFGNTATQNINLTGIITTTTLNVGSTANILNSNLTGQTKITGGLFDRLNSIGTAGQVLTSTGTQVEWYTIPTIIPNLQQVLTSGNTAVNNIILTGNLSANNAALLTSTISTSLTLLGTLKDGLSSAGTNNQVLSSNVTGVRWINLPVYSAASPLLYNSGTGVFSIQQANASQGGFLSAADWITFDGKQTAIILTTTGNSGPSTLIGSTINVPNYTLSGLGGVPQTRTLTINGVTFDLSADRSWTISAGVSSVTATSPLFSTGGATPDISIQQSSSSLDGYLSSADWLIFNSKQALLGGTGLVKSVGGTISYITDNSANWNTAYNDSIVSAAVTGTATKTLTLNQQDGGTITASWSDIDTGLTSVGVSMPTAFTVTNSPLTSNGTIAITGSGNSLQYIDGTGALQTFPSLTGYVPYTGATQNVNLGIYSLTASSLIKNGGTSSQFLKADGSVDSSAYIVLGSLSASAPLSYNNTTGAFSISQSGAATDGYLSSTDWNTFNNKQGALTLTTTGSSGASTLIGNTLNIPAYTDQFVGTVTSVGISMPSAFTVSNSPVTSAGTLTVVGAGLASQYVRGDGSLGDFPGGGGGGGSSVSYYLNGSVNQGTFVGNTYYEMSKVPIFGAGTDFNIATNGYISQFITNANDPESLLIPAGNWNFEFYFSASSSGGTPTFYVELYKYDGTTFTLIASNSANPELIAFGTIINPYFSPLAVPETVLAITDRLAIRVYVNNSGRTITLHTENSHLCQIITTFTTGLTTLNGLTKQVQYLATGTSGTDFNISSSVATHTFNIPSASATNRGLVTTGSQTIAGNKTTTSNIDVNGVMVGRGASSGDVFAGIGGNTAVGSQALLSITTGFPNTALGSEALRNITTGANNIAIGSTAGKLDVISGSANATSNSSIYIGNNSRPNSNGGSNEIVIGNNGTGSGSNTVTIGNSLTTQNYFTGNIYGGAFIKSGGTSSQFLKADGSVDSTVYGTGTVTSVSFSLGSSGTDLSSSVTNSTTTPAITLNVPTASATNRGALSAADWTTFNSKQPAGNYVTLDTTQTITALKTILRSGDVLNFKIGVDTLYGLRIAYNQNELVPAGEATWSFVNTFNNGSGTGLETTPISFFRGVLVTGERLLSVSVNTNLLDYYGNNPSGRYPIYAYNTGVQQFASSIIVGETNGVVNAATGAIADLPAGVVANFKGRVIGSNAVNSNEFITLSQATSTSRLAISLTTTGSSGPATYNNTTGVFNIPEYAGTVNPSAREIETFIATASQTTFTVTGGYTVGLVDVFINGVRLTSSDYTATNGTTVVLAVGTMVNNIVDIIKYTSGIVNSISGSGTTNELAYFTASTTIASLTTATYPSLTELSYVKGVTSSIQTQLNGKQAAGTYVTSVTGTSPIVSSGGTTPAISIPVATTSVNGYLSSTDWTTFNNKASTAALAAYLPLAGGTLTGALNGTSATFSGDLIAVSATLNTPANAVGVLLNGRTSDNVSQIRFGAYTGGGAYNTIQASPTSFDINSQGNTPITFGTNVGGGGGTRVTITGAGAVTLTGALNGTSATFTGTALLGGASATNPLSIRTADGESYLRFLNADGTTYGDLERSITGAGAVRFTGANFRFTAGAEVVGTLTGAAATFSSSVTSSSNFNVTRNGLNTVQAGYLLETTSGTLYLANQQLDASGGLATWTYNPTNGWNSRMTIASDGTKYFGNPSGSRFQITASGENVYQYTNTYYIWGLYNDGNSLSIESAFAGNIIFRTANQGTSSSPTTTSPRMTITSSGLVTIGNTSPASGATRLSVYSSTDTAFSSSLYCLNSSGANAFLVRGDGVINTGTLAGSPYNNTSAQIPNLYVSAGGTLERGTASSGRFKENIINWDGNGLDTILALKPKTFKYKKDYYNKADIDFLGLIAEDVAQVSPYLADYENEDRTGQVENVRYATIVVPLIKAIQELKSELDELKSKN